MATDDQSEGPVNPAPSSGAPVDAPRAVPVRSAPLSRRRKIKPLAAKAVPEPASTDEEAVDESTAAADESTADVYTVENPAATASWTEREQTREPRPAPSSPYRTVDRVDPRSALLGIGAAVLAVVLIAASALLGIGAYRLQRLNDLRAEYDAFAQQVTVNLTSLNAGNVDNIRKTLLDKTSGTAQQNLELVTQQIITQIEQYGIQTNGEVMSRAVTVADPDYGQVLMVLGWTQRLSNKKDDVERQVFRWKVDMRRINGELKLTKFDWVS